MRESDAAKRRGPRAEPSVRIAIVEDDPALRQRLTSALREAGYEVWSSAGPMQAFATIPPPELVVLGRTATRVETAARTPGEGAPLLALHDVTGADAFLRPPFTVLELQETVELLLRLTRERALAAPATLVDVGKVLDSALTRARAELDTCAQITCEFDTQLRVLASPEQLCLVFLSLLLGAANRMNEESRATNGIRVAGWRTAQGRTVVEISDTGRRIPADQLAVLFEASSGGFTPLARGLSLPASQRAMSSRGGAITVTSTAGGSSFRVELPTAAG